MAAYRCSPYDHNGYREPSPDTSSENLMVAYGAVAVGVVCHRVGCQDFHSVAPSRLLPSHTVGVRAVAHVVVAVAVLGVVCPVAVVYVPEEIARRPVSASPSASDCLQLELDCVISMTPSEPPLWPPPITSGPVRQFLKRIFVSVHRRSCSLPRSPPRYPSAVKKAVLSADEGTCQPS